MREARGPFAAGLVLRKDSEFSKNALDDAAHAAATSPLLPVRGPTEAERSAGNYKKGHITVSGIDIAIENPAGSKRRPEWPALKDHYGYIKRTTGADGDHVDCFVREGCRNDFSGPVFVVNQIDQRTGEFDEHKCMIGWNTLDEAKAAYLDNFTKPWKVGPITQMRMADFKAWLRDGDTTVEKAMRGQSATPIKRAITPHIAPLQATIYRRLQALARQIAAKMARKAGLKKTSKEVEELLAEIANGDWEMVGDDISPELRDAFARAGYGENEEAGANIDLELIDAAAVEYADARAAELVTEISETTRDQLRDLVTDALEESYTTGQLADALEDSFSFSEQRAGLIARTELATAHTHGRIDVAKQAGGKRKKWLLSADHDDDANCDCSDAADAGEVDMDDSFTDDPDYDFPPGHPNACFDGTTYVAYGDTTQMVRSRYSGPATTLTLRGRSGDILFTIGPNHPVLTNRGLVKASHLCVGDYLLRDQRVPTVLRPEVNLEQAPFFEDAFQTLSASLPISRGSSAADYFHGDQRFIYGEVDAVNPTSRLLPVLNSGSVESLRQCSLIRTDVTPEHLASCSACQLHFSRMFDTANGIVHRVEDSISIFSLQSSLMATSLEFGSSNRASGDGSLSSLIERELRVVPFEAFRVIARHDTYHTGWAFDASTTSGFYLNNGFVVSNCWCDWVAVYGDDDDDDEEEDDENGDDAEG